MATKVTETPLMKQYFEMKKKHPDAILLFRVGDFYETFGEDAIASSEILGITLTHRVNGSSRYVELAGFPHHALDTYLPKLVRAGRRVAICEQLEDPKHSKSVVKRGITESVTPGTQNKPKENIPDLTPVFFLLSLLIDIIEQLYKFEEIRRKTAEIRAISYQIRISPKLAFNACYEDLMKQQQKSLFDNI